MEQPKRKTLRLEGYDYSRNGCYFVTVCTTKKQSVLCRLVGAGLCARPEVQLTAIGKTIEAAIAFIDGIEGYRVDHYVIMPNHIHLLIVIERESGGHGGPPLQTVIGRFKSFTTREYGKPLWQRGFYDHIIRDDEDYFTHWRYIDENPLKWTSDAYYAP